SPGRDARGGAGAGRRALRHPHPRRCVSGSLRTLARALSPTPARTGPHLRQPPRPTLDAEPGRAPGAVGAPARAHEGPLMSASPAVSVLVTAYNREDFLRESIESVLAQSFTDFELIVSDDHSRDETVAIASDCARRDRRVRVSVNAGNLGDYGNRRQALSLARGRFVKYHDS